MDFPQRRSLVGLPESGDFPDGLVIAAPGNLAAVRRFVVDSSGATPVADVVVSQSGYGEESGLYLFRRSQTRSLLAVPMFDASGQSLRDAFTLAPDSDPIPRHPDHDSRLFGAVPVDFDGDGVDEILATLLDVDRIGVLGLSAEGTWEWLWVGNGPQLALNGSSVVMLRGDVDGDGTDEGLVVSLGSVPDYDPERDRVFVVSSSGENDFAETTYELGLAASEATVGDFNGDGLSDLLVVRAGTIEQDPSHASLLLASPAGFGAPELNDLGSDNWFTRLHTVRLEQQDADGVVWGDPCYLSLQAPDLLAGSTQLDTGFVAEVADINGDGVTDLLAFDIDTTNPRIFLSIVEE